MENTADMVKKIKFITSNKNKLAELRDILGDELDIQSQSLITQEIQGSIEEICLDKCRKAANEVCKSNPKTFTLAHLL